MTGEWSRRAMAPIEHHPLPDPRRDDRPGQDGGRRGRWEAARDATEGVRRHRQLAHRRARPRAGTPGSARAARATTLPAPALGSG